MKSVVIITLLLISYLCNKTQINDDSGIVFNSTVYQMGLIKRGSITEHVFFFVNKSKTPVVITNVIAYCSCVVPTWTKEPVMQNDSGIIKVKYYANTIGTFNKTVKVFTNRNNQLIGLTVKGECR